MRSYIHIPISVMNTVVYEDQNHILIIHSGIFIFSESQYMKEILCIIHMYTEKRLPSYMCISFLLIMTIDESRFPR